MGEATSRAALPAIAGERHPCTPSERLLALMHDALDGEGTGTFVAPCDRHLPPDGIAAALARLQRRHPKLRSALVRDDRGEPQFEVYEECAPIPWTWQETGAPDAWRELALHHRPPAFPPGSAPLLRFAFLAERAADRTWLVCWVHHAVADLLSVWQLLGELLEFLAHPERPVTVAAGGFDVVPPRARFTPGDGWALLRRGFNRFVADRLLRTAIPPADGASPGGLALWHLSVEETARFRDACRAHGSTVFFTLAAASMMALAEHYGWHGRRISCQSPVDLRRRLLAQGERDAIGMLAGGVRVRIRLPAAGESLWSAARRYRARWTREYRQNHPLRAIQSTRRAPFSPWMLGGRNGALVVNHFGRLTQPASSGTPRLLDLVAWGQARYVGPALSVHAVTVNDQLGVTVRSECLSQATHDRLRDALRQCMEAALSEP